ncbi:MAG: DegT/DnrJ/EryC1/StrS family aminotransferase [Alphaproteobacteria bacterium]
MFGATYKGKKVGTFGHIATLSFYPAHHITMGEGAVLTNRKSLNRLIVTEIGAATVGVRRARIILAKNDMNGSLAIFLTDMIINSPILI